MEEFEKFKIIFKQNYKEEKGIEIFKHDVSIGKEPTHTKEEKLIHFEDILKTKSV